MKLIPILILLLIPSAIAINIHEVYYDPINSESGGEAVVLFSENEIDISNYFLRTELSDFDVTFPEGTIFKGYFLVADKGWNEKKDSSEWRSADYEEAITLTNSNAGVALFDDDENLLDAVGWGDASNIDTGLFMGSPSSPVSSGRSLLRINNSKNNFNDFISSKPILEGQKKISNSTQKIIDITIEKIQKFPKINSIILNSKNLFDGKMLLVPGKNTSLFVQANLSFTNSSYPVFINGIEGFNQTLYLSYNTSPGIYEISVVVGDEEQVVEYEVLPLLSLDVDSTSLNFKTSENIISIIGDNNFSTSSQPTILNSGNIPLSLQITGGNFEYSIDGITGNAISETVLNVDLLPGKTTPLDLSFSIPDEKIYSFSVVVIAK